jgi:hypothetical protein
MARTSASSRPLTDHNDIRRWAEDRGAHPACVRGTGDSSDIGMIRLDFPGYSGEGKLEEISWEEWFDKFDESGLALLVQDETARGERSNFNKLVSRETAGVSGAGGSRSSRSQKSSGRSSGENEGRDTSAGYVEDDFGSSEDDLELEDEMDIEESQPVRRSAAGNSRSQKRQSGAKRATVSRSTRRSSSVRATSSQAGRSRKQKSRSASSKKGRVTSRARSKAKKAPARATSSTSRTTRGRSTGRKRAA